MGLAQEPMMSLLQMTYGCETQGSVVVIDPTEPCFFIPGGLTPNGDGANETWEIGGLSQYPDAKVMRL